MSKVTQVKAEKVLAAIKTKYASYLEGASEADQPSLKQDWQTFSSTAPFAIVWETGPSDWALVATSGDPTEEDWALCAEVGATPSGSAPIKVPAGVFAEPITSYSLGLYPA